VVREALDLMEMGPREATQGELQGEIVTADAAMLPRPHPLH